MPIQDGVPPGAGTDHSTRSPCLGGGSDACPRCTGTPVVLCLLPKTAPASDQPEGVGPTLSRIAALYHLRVKTGSCECSPELGRIQRRGTTGVTSAHRLRIRRSSLHDRPTGAVGPDSPDHHVLAHGLSYAHGINCVAHRAPHRNRQVPCVVAGAGPSGPVTGGGRCGGRRGFRVRQARAPRAGLVRMGSRHVRISRTGRDRTRKRSLSCRCLEACMRSGPVRVKCHATGLTLFGHRGAG